MHYSKYRFIFAKKLTMTKADLKYLNELLPDRRVLYDQDGNMVLSYVDDVRYAAARMADYMERKYKIPLEKVRKKRAANGRKIKVLQAKIKKIKGCMNDNKKIANEIAVKIMKSGHYSKEGIQQRRDIENAILEMAAIKDEKIKALQNQIEILERQLCYANAERDRLETELTFY